MPASRLVRLVVALLALGPALGRVAILAADSGRPIPCQPEGRGQAPRGWIGCEGDRGPPRELDGAERLSLGLPIDLNRATPGELRLVPGLSAKLAEAVVADRARRGPFTDVDDLERVRGIGPARLKRAGPHLYVGQEPGRSRGADDERSRAR